MFFKLIFILQLVIYSEASDAGLENLKKSLLSSKNRSERLQLLIVYKKKIVERLKDSDLGAVEEDVYFSQLDFEKGNCATYLKDLERVRGNDKLFHYKMKELVEIACQIEK